MKTLDNIKRKLFQHIDSFENKHYESSTIPSIQRIKIDVKDISILEWLNGQPFETKIYWSSRDQNLKIAGAGTAFEVVADSLSSMQRMRQILKVSDEHTRFYGGIRFDASRSCDENWSSFKKLRFVVPRFELLTQENHQFLVLNVPKNCKESYIQEAKEKIIQLAPEKKISGKTQHVSDIKMLPSKKEWQDIVETSLRSIASGEFEKIVLAGKTILSFDHPVDIMNILAHIMEQNKVFHYYFQFESNIGFLGMTPESLFRLKNDNIFSEAIAATRKRGKTSHKDDILGEEMLNSDKDLREHRWVKKMIIDRLEPFCDEIEVTSNETLLKLSNVQHLASIIKGHLKIKTPVEDLLLALHPTPAVGGYPRQTSMEKIAELEYFDRGWYAAPVGWLSENAAEFAVAIRSALAVHNELHVFAGSGIVKGSEPKTEWSENMNKAQNFLQLFDI